MWGRGVSRRGEVLACLRPGEIVINRRCVAVSFLQDKGVADFPFALVDSLPSCATCPLLLPRLLVVSRCPATCRRAPALVAHPSSRCCLPQPLLPPRVLYHPSILARRVHASRFAYRPLLTRCGSAVAVRYPVRALPVARRGGRGRGGWCRWGPLGGACTVTSRIASC